MAVRHAPVACAAARGPSLGSSCSASTQGPRARSPCLHATPPSVHQGTARHGMAWHSMAWHGMARHGRAWHARRPTWRGTETGAVACIAQPIPRGIQRAPAGLSRTYSEYSQGTARLACRAERLYRVKLALLHLARHVALRHVMPCGRRPPRCHCLLSTRSTKSEYSEYEK